METSILKSTKKNLGIDEANTAFDEEILTNINTAFSTLNQLGLGPEQGFRVEDDEPVWADFTQDDPRFDSVKTFVQLQTKLLFDPPKTSYVLTAMEKQLEQFTWRLNELRESEDWTPPPSEEDDEDE